MSAGKVNLIIEQGATWQVNLTVQDDGELRNLTGYEARLQVREEHASSDPLLSISDADYIVLGGSAGTVAIEVPAEVTAGLPAGNWVYDLELVIGEDVERLIEGRAIVTPEVTR